MRVLFVGNSYTFYEDVPAQVAALAAEGGQTIQHDRVVEGGADWEKHWRALGAPQRIAEGWDVVVLQSRSTDPLLKPRRFHRFGRRLADAAKATRAQVVLYQTWAWAADHPAYRQRWSRHRPEAWLAVVRRHHLRLARAVDATLAPVGEAWARSLGAHPELDLHEADRHHASPLGAHLAAAVLLATLTRLDPRRLRWRPADVPATSSATLKAVAARI